MIRREVARTGHDNPAGILTLLEVCTQTIAIIGPSLGGLIGIGGWRATFAVNAPLALACVILGTQRVPKPISAGSIVGSIGDRDRRAGVASTIDLAGIALFTATLVAVLLYLMHPQPGNWYLRVLTAAAGAGLAWVIASAHQGQGYARHATEAVVRWLRKLGANLIIAHVHPYHQASMAVAAGIGMSASETVVDSEVRWVG